MQDLNSLPIHDDPTWGRALEIVRGKLHVPPQLNHIVRNGWYGSIEREELVRNLGFLRLNLSSLLNAAEMLGTDASTHKAADLERAITFLGIRYSCVVLAVNYTVSVVLNAKPPRYWRNVMREMMTDIEIGYRFGNKSSSVGLESGMVLGFVKGAGLSLLMALDPERFTSWYSKTKGFEDRQYLIECFGCEPYQVAAMAVQQLGFGTDLATGAGLAMGGLDPKHLELNEEILTWRAVYMWIQALREGRNYPGPLDVRHRFQELIPPRDKTQRNVSLEVLYTEIAKIRRAGSEWTWHLPKPGYDAAADDIRSK